MIYDIIVPVHSDTSQPAWPAEGYAISLAAIFGAHLTAVAPSFVQPVTGMLRAEIPAELIEEAERQSDTTAQTAISSFQERAAHAGVLHQGVIQRGGPAEFADAFAARARAFDLAVVPQPEGEGVWEQELVEAVLFNSGRPALIVPYVHRGEAQIERVLVAWDGSKEAARAVHDALPLLRRAEAVEVLTIHTERRRTDAFIPGADLATHLARHGLQVSAKGLDGIEIGVTEALLSHAADTAADLVVMGGYAHSRLRRLVFGSATSGILSAMTSPVVMAH